MKNISGKEEDADNSDSSEEPQPNRRERAERQNRKRRMSERSDSGNDTDDSCVDGLDVSHLRSNGSKPTAASSEKVSSPSKLAKAADCSRPAKSPLKTPSKSVRPAKSPLKTPTKSPPPSMSPVKTPKKAASRSPTKEHKGAQQSSPASSEEGEEEIQPQSQNMDELWPENESLETVDLDGCLPLSTASPEKSRRSEKGNPPCCRASPSGDSFAMESFSVRKRFPKDGPSPAGIMKQSRMTKFVSSISERQADMELEMTSLQSPGSSRSASPTVSDGGMDSLFKTPREKSAYRALNYSPSDGAGNSWILFVLCLLVLHFYL